MQIGMVGLGRMGADMVRRLSAGGHECIAHDVDARAVDRLAGSGIFVTTDRAEFLARLATPRVLWLMVPAAAVDRTLDGFLPSLAPGDVVIDGGNSWYGDARGRAERLTAAKVHFIDCGTSGGVHGRERGYCLMLGGEPEVIGRLDPLFATLAPGREAAPPTPGRGDRRDTADRGYLHCGPTGAGHFVKMVHNGIEYGLMAAYAEGLDLLRHADAGGRRRRADAESAPMHDPEAYRYEFDLPAIAELWRRGSVIGSWLLDLTASALAGDPALRGYRDEVADSGEGRWALQAAVEVGAPANILAAALFSRFASRGAASFQGQLLSAMRGGFGGHPADAAERERAEEHRGRSGSA